MDNKTVNLLIEDLKNNLIADVQNSNLPLGICYYIAKDIFKELESAYFTTLNKEVKNYLASQKEEEKNGDNKEMDSR